MITVFQCLFMSCYFILIYGTSVSKKLNDTHFLNNTSFSIHSTSESFLTANSTKIHSLSDKLPGDNLSVSIKPEIKLVKGNSSNLIKHMVVAFEGQPSLNLDNSKVSGHSFQATANNSSYNKNSSVSLHFNKANRTGVNLEENIFGNYSKKKPTEGSRITARKGATLFDLNVTHTLPPVVNNYSSKVTSAKPETTSMRHKKPKFTMVKGDKETKVSKSFIESPTTGKDYIFPIVLIILAIPLVLMLIKLIYKRGSEYSERRYYDRMYLIDGMYNAR